MSCCGDDVTGSGRDAGTVGRCGGGGPGEAEAWAEPEDGNGTMDLLQEVPGVQVGFHLWLLFPHGGRTWAIPEWPRLVSQVCELKGSRLSSPNVLPSSAPTHRAWAPDP